MIDLLSQILCWVKAIGCMVLDALVAAANLVVAGLGLVVAGLIGAWPIDMPDLPDVPSQFTTALGWVAWSPVPIIPAIQFLLFSVTVWVAWKGVETLLRWAKVVE